MENTSPKSGQENLSAALSCIIFFLPLLLGVKTPFVVKYMKQGFLINLMQVSLYVIGMILWFLSPILAVLSFGLFFLSLFLAYQAYSWVEYSFAMLSENAERIIEKLGLAHMFAPGK